MSSASRRQAKMQYAGRHALPADLIRAARDCGVPTQATEPIAVPSSLRQTMDWPERTGVSLDGKLRPPIGTKRM